MTNKRKRQSEGRLAQIDIPACAYDYTFEVGWEQLVRLLDPPEILPGELEALFNQCARHGNGDVLLNTAIEGGDGDEMLDMDRLDDIIIYVHVRSAQLILEQARVVEVDDPSVRFIFFISFYSTSNEQAKTINREQTAEFPHSGMCARLHI